MRRKFLVLTGLTVTALLGACASTSTAPSLYQLRAEPPLAMAAVAAVVAQPGTHVLQLLLPVSLPEVLERDAIVIAQGAAGVHALPGHRWAEPLRDAVPRLLRQDLALLLGETRVWAAPLPAGVTVTRQLRVDVLVLQTTADRSAVALQARWTLSDPLGRTAPVVQTTQLSVATAGSEPAAWVAAHRVALWRLAEQIAKAVQ